MIDTPVEHPSATLTPTSSRPPRHELLTLTLIGLASATVYLVRLALPMSLRQYLASPLIDLPKIVGETNVGAWYYFDTMLALFALYIWGYRVVLRLRREGHVTGTGEAGALGGIIVGYFIVLCAILALMFPVTAGDLFNYIFYGRIWAFQGLNPYIVPPNAVPEDISYEYTIFRDLATVYGPGFSHLSAWLARVAGNNLLVNVYVFKAALVTFHALSVWLVYLTLRRIQPTYAWAGAYLMAWNPLVLFNTAGDGHNDITMLAFVLLAFYLVACQRWGLAVIALTLAATMKWLSILLIPIFLIAGLRALGWRRWPILAGGLTVGVGLTVGMFVPFYTTPSALFGSAPDISASFTASTATVVRDILSGYMDQEQAGRWARLIAYSLFAPFYLWCLLRVHASLDSLTYASFQTFFFYLALGTLWFQPWYVVWLVGLGALLAGTAVAWRMVAFSFSAMLIHIVTGFGWRIGWFDTYKPYLQLLAVTLVFALPIIMWLAERRPLERGSSAALPASEQA